MQHVEPQRVGARRARRLADIKERDATGASTLLVSIAQSTSSGAAATSGSFARIQPMYCRRRTNLATVDAMFPIAS
jgi:hypothetical protein